MRVSIVGSACQDQRLEIRPETLILLLFFLLCRGLGVLLFKVTVVCLHFLVAALANCRVLIIA